MADGDFAAEISEFAAQHGGLRHPAHDSEVEIGGYTHYVRRSIELHRALEQAFGPLRHLHDRLHGAVVTVDEIIRLTEIILRHAPEHLRPTRRQIEAHIYERGVTAVVKPIGDVVSCLFLGNARAQEYLAGLPQSDRPEVPAANPTRAA